MRLRIVAIFALLPLEDVSSAADTAGSCVDDGVDFVDAAAAAG